MSPILLDTHAAVWGANGTLGKAASRLVDVAAQKGELLISPVTAWEIGMLHAKGRLVLTCTVQDYVRALFGRPGVITATLTPEIGAAAASLPQTFPQDPADRMIVATARTYGAQLLTRDKLIHAYAKSTKSLRCISC